MDRSGFSLSRVLVSGPGSACRVQLVARHLRWGGGGEQEMNASEEVTVGSRRFKGRRWLSVLHGCIDARAVLGAPRQVHCWCSTLCCETVLHAPSCLFA